MEGNAGSATVPDLVPRAQGKRPSQGEPVVDRALSLLSAFDADRRRLTLAELSRRSRIPVSSTLRLATRLLSWGALERDEEGRYCIGLRLLEGRVSGAARARAAPGSDAVHE